MAAAIIENVGPVEKLEIPETPNGGIIVFTGRNGAGKSTAIKAVDSLISGKRQPVPTRDGEAYGFCEGWGAKLTIGKTTRRSGEIEVTALESKINPALLVDPGIKDADAADDHRIRALVSLAGVKPDLELFHAAFGDKRLFEVVVDADAILSDDLVAMAGKVKRAAESKAREFEAMADATSARAKEKSEKPDGLDESIPHDKVDLQADYDRAYENYALLYSARGAALRFQADAAEARKELDGAKEQYDVDSAKRAFDEADNKLNTILWNIGDLKAQLSELETAAKLAASSRDRAADALKSARAMDEHCAKLHEIIAQAESAECPTEELVAAALAEKNRAAEAVNVGVRVREYLERKAESERLTIEANNHRKRADRLRQAASNCADILSRAVQSAGIPELRVAGGRLVTTTKRGSTLFADLSVGERWRIALDIAIRQVGKGGVFAVPQEAWDALDVHNRRAIDKQVRAAGVTIITAETLQDAQAATDVGYRIYE